MQDAHGQPVIGATEEAVALYNAAIGAMAHLGKLWSFALAPDAAMAGPLESLIATVSTLTMDERKHGHISALRAAVLADQGIRVHPQGGAGKDGLSRSNRAEPKPRSRGDTRYDEHNTRVA
jgi:hypothetical protein